MLRFLVLSAAAIMSAVITGKTYAQTIVPAEVWADTDTVTSLDMSPNGERVAMLMRRERGGMPDLVMFDTDDVQGSIRAIETELQPISFFWANDRYLVVTFILETMQAGDPVILRRIASFDTRTNEWESMLRVGGSTTRNRMDAAMATVGQGFVASSLRDDPDHVLIGHTESFGDSPNYYRTNVANGRRELVFRGTGRFGGISFDRDGQARGATEYDAGRNRVVTMARAEAGAEWTEIGALNADERLRFGLLGFFHAENPNLITVLADEAGSNTSGIYTIDLRSGDRELLFKTEDYDALGVITSPRASDGSRIVGYRYADHEGPKRYFIDEEIGSLYASLEAAFPDSEVFISRVSDDNRTVLFGTTGPQDPGTWYMLRDGAAARLMTRNSELPADALSPTRVLRYTARDGREMSGYVTIPQGEGPFPAIAMPHGGPWVRDSLGYDEWAQMLANRGWVVFQPNYRGSTELGRDHWIAGDGQWGLAMQDDVDDGMMTLVEQGIADPERLGFFGWSYGGYSAFVAAVEEDPIYNCSVAGAGISDITRIRGGLAGDRFLRRFQRPTITGVSPIEEIENLEMPMLIVHGDFDFTVPVDQSRLFIEAAGPNADIEYIEIENMGHSPIRYEENMQWYPQLFEFFETRCGF
jgi:dipeptidyl aminopeptidase/acylaminoacyl peptidase